jgi:hypothetical protein
MVILLFEPQGRTFVAKAAGKEYDTGIISRKGEVMVKSISIEYCND